MPGAAGIIRSFELAPPLATPDMTALVAGVAAAADDMLLIAVQIAAPLIVALVITDVALGLMSKAVPQMNVFIVGLPLKIVVALAGTATLLSSFVTYIDTLDAAPGGPVTGHARGGRLRGRAPRAGGATAVAASARTAPAVSHASLHRREESARIDVGGRQAPRGPAPSADGPRPEGHAGARAFDGSLGAVRPDRSPRVESIERGIGRSRGSSLSGLLAGAPGWAHRMR